LKKLSRNYVTFNRIFSSTLIIIGTLNSTNSLPTFKPKLSYDD